MSLSTIKKIIDIGTTHGLNLSVKFVREDFDILGYEVYTTENLFICYDRYFTGKTIRGNEYPSDKEEFMQRIEASIKEYSLTVC